MILATPPRRLVFWDGMSSTSLFKIIFDWSSSTNCSRAHVVPCSYSTCLVPGQFRLVPGQFRLRQRQSISIIEASSRLERMLLWSDRFLLHGSKSPTSEIWVWGSLKSSIPTGRRARPLKFENLLPSWARWPLKISFQVEFEDLLKTFFPIEFEDLSKPTSQLSLRISKILFFRIFIFIFIFYVLFFWAIIYIYFKFFEQTHVIWHTMSLRGC